MPSHRKHVLREWFDRFRSQTIATHSSPLAIACDLVAETIGVNTLFDICRHACETKEGKGEQLRMIVLGALHNIINSNGRTGRERIVLMFRFSFSMQKNWLMSSSKKTYFDSFFSTYRIFRNRKFCSSYSPSAPIWSITIQVKPSEQRSPHISNRL